MKSQADNYFRASTDVLCELRGPADVRAGEAARGEGRPAELLALDGVHLGRIFSLIFGQ